MKILRIKLKNYRGVAEREVKLAPSGVTVIEGPNEIGKSSLAEAVDVIFSYLDTSTRARALKPVHADEGSEVEVDVECGPYAFTYFKRFHKRPTTSLRVTRPRAESLTGREAHERVRSILNEVLDVELWEALRVHQGKGLEQAKLKDSPSLGAALDKAAGGAQAGGRDESLFEAAQKEYERYFTPKEKRPSKELYESEAKLSQAQAELAAVSDQLAKMEADAARFASLENEVARLKNEKLRLEANAASRQTEWRAVQDLIKERSALESGRKEAQLLAGAAALELETRKKDLDAIAGTRRELDELRVKLDAGASQRRAVKDAVESGARALADAQAAADRAAAILELRRRDHELRRDELDLSQLRERKARVDKAVEDAEASEELLRRTAVTGSLLADIEKAHVDLEVSRSTLEAARTELRIEALRDIEPEVGGSRLPLREGEARVVPVEGTLELHLPGIARLTVRSGGSATTLVAEHEQASRRYQALCGQGKVAGVAEARQVHEARREAERVRARKNEIVKNDLRDLTRADLEQRIAELDARRRSAPPRGDGDPPLPASLDEARTVLAAAETAARAAAEAHARQRRAFEAARDACARQEKVEIEDATRLKLLGERIEAAQRAMDDVRSRRPDDVLGGELAAAAARVAAADAAFSESARRLAAAQPEKVEELERNARHALEIATANLRNKEDEILEVRTRLREHGEDGLEERRGGAHARVERLQLEREGLLARAAAARLLFETLSANRDAARRRYLQPLRERIERLGSIVFGDSFQVGLDDNLQVETRTVDGRTVRFEDLSAGAREQIGVIVRVACAMTVSAHGGVALILDDALGYCDPERLQEMGAVLSRAGRETQIIVLTCMPERYRHVGSASVVSLSRGRNV